MMNVTTITVSTDQPCTVTERENINMFVPQQSETVCIDETPVTIVIPQGIAGATGPQGPQGPIGNTGPQGEQGNPGSPGIGVPSGGSTGQILAKIDGTDYNTEWKDAPDATFQESVTYAQLVTLIDASGLTPGKRYLISDFETRFYKLDGGVPIPGSETGGGIEGIIVTASTANTLSAVAESIVHPSDILYYDWNADNWTSDAFYSISGVIVPGWKGVITRRIDTVRNIDCDFNFRAFTYRLWGITAPAYNAGATYNLGDTVLSGGKMFTCKAYGVTGVATSNAASWQPILGVILSGTDKYWSTSSAGIAIEIPDIDNVDVSYCNIATDGTFQDFPVFPLASNDSRNITIRGIEGFSAAGFVAKTGCYNTDFSGTQSVFGAVSNTTFKAGCSIIYFSSLDSSEFGASTNTCIGATVIAIHTGTQCRNLFFGEQTNGVSLGDNVYNMQFGRDCYYSSINAGNNAQFTSMSGFKAESLSYSKFDALVEDTLVSVGFDYNKFFGSVSGLRVDQQFQSNTFYNQVQFVRFGALCNNNLFNGIIVRTEFGSDYNNNTHNGDCTNTRVGNSASFNVWPGLLSCEIGNDAANNIQSVFSGDYFAVTAGNGFSGNDLGQTENCSFGDGCSNNVGQFVRCVFYNSFSRNTFAATVSDAVGGGNFQNDDYSSATIIYQPGTKQLITNSNGDKLIVYIDGSNVQQIVSNLS